MPNSTRTHVFEESLRWDAAVQPCTRFTTEPVEIRGVGIPAGETVQCMLGAVNRDPARFEDPDRFNPDRPNVRDHLSSAPDAISASGPRWRASRRGRLSRGCSGYRGCGLTRSGPAARTATSSARRRGCGWCGTSDQGDSREFIRSLLPGVHPRRNVFASRPSLRHGPPGGRLPRGREAAGRGRRQGSRRHAVRG